MNEINRWSVAETAGNIAARKVSVLEVVEAHLDRIDVVNPKINAITQVLDDARDQARALDAGGLPSDPPDGR